MHHDCQGGWCISECGLIANQGYDFLLKGIFREWRAIDPREILERVLVTGMTARGPSRRQRPR
jgi:hypothetical protein